MNANTDQQPVDPRRRFNFWFIFVSLLGIWVMHGAIIQATQVETLSYDRFLSLVEADRIESLVVRDNRLSGVIRDPGDGEKSRFVTVRVDADLTRLLADKNIEFSALPHSNLIRDIVSWVLPAVVFVGIWLLAMRYFAKKGGGLGGSFMAVGKSKAKVYVENDTRKSFADVAGVDEAKQELEEVVAFLKAPDRFSRFGARMPKGILLVGPPGTGKTLLAKAVAGEAGVPFFSISGSEFVEMFVGVGAARVRDLFEQARKRSPCIVFIDELDALGKARAPGQIGGHDEKEQTLNQLLVEMDGFDTKSGIILLAASNRPEVLDPALLRAGRFDRQVLVDRPDKTGRLQILAVHLRKLRNVDAGLDLAAVATMTAGFSGADLENLVNEAALAATRKGAEQVSTVHFEEGIERIVAGLERKNRLLNSREREVVAYHEMGHAIVAKALETGEKLHKVSIVPRGVGALGYTMQKPTEERYLMTREELEARIAVLLGGRAAEKLKFRHESTGASDDIAKATAIARDMVTRYGMCAEVGLFDMTADKADFLRGRHGGLAVSAETARLVDVAVSRIVEQGQKTALDMLRRNQSVLSTTAGLLLEKETLNEQDLEELLRSVQTVRIHSLREHAADRISSNG